MSIKLFKIGPLGTNCYVYTDEQTGQSLVVDPGFESPALLEELRKLNLTYILVTHAHADHIAAVAKIKEFSGAKVVAHKNEKKRFESAAENLYVFIEENGGTYKASEIDIEVDDNDDITLGQTKIKVLYTPGHTDGSVSYILKDSVFVGDTVFKESFGRTDLPTGNFSKIIDSYNKICELEGEYQILPGHEDTTTLSHEREFNPLRRYL